MRILIAEDDLDIATLYKKALEKNKHSVSLRRMERTVL